jgi:carboxymethylenebutenolidase
MFDGKVAATIDEAKTLRSQAKREKVRRLLHASVEALRKHPQALDTPINVVGFSLGAYYALSLLQEVPQEIGALVVYYGVSGGSYEGVTARVLDHYAETDEYMAKSSEKKLEKALKAAGVDVTFYEYAGTEHWFAESNQPSAYKAAAELAWARTLNFLRRAVT